MSDVVQVQFAVDDGELAGRLVDTLLDEHLIACGQLLGPVRSRYRWQGALEAAEEWLVLCKTTEARSAEALARIGALHPYEVPEVLVLPAVAGAEPYLDWVRDATLSG